MDTKMPYGFERTPSVQIDIIKATNGTIIFYNGKYHIAKDQWDFRRIIEDIHNELCKEEERDGLERT